MSGELYFKCRTNFFTPTDRSALESLCKHTGMYILQPNPRYNVCAKPGQVALNAPLGWPSQFYADDPFGTKDLIAPRESIPQPQPFNTVKHLMPLVSEGQVLVIQEIAFNAELLIGGVAHAYRRLGEIVREVHVDLNNIYSIAAELFHVDASSICPAEY